jgi:hypothetical protein
VGEQTKWGDLGRDKELSETEWAELERLRKENTALKMERNFAKSSGLVRETTAAKYAAIADWAEQKAYSVTFMCDQLGGCVRGTTRGARQGRASVSVPTPSSPNTSSKSTPSWTGIPACAKAGPSVVRGARIEPKRVGRLMRAAGLRGRHP